MCGYVFFCFVEWLWLCWYIFVVVVLIFMFCFVSFVIVFLLGGGLKVIMIELVIYQVLSFDYDLV